MSEVTVGVRDLKTHLSEYLRHIKQGQTMIITDHGHPVARLLPMDLSLEERILLLSRARMVAWDGLKLEPIQPAAVSQSDRQVSDVLVELRELS